MNEVVAALVAKRAVCERWPEGAGKTAALAAIEEIIDDIEEKGAASVWLAVP